MSAPGVTFAGASNAIDAATSDSVAGVVVGAGDTVLILGMVENNTAMSTPTASGSTGLSFANMAGSPTNNASACKGYAWSGTATSGGTVTITSSGNTALEQGFAVWVIAAGTSIGFGTPAILISTSKTNSLARTGDNSAVAWIGGDFSADLDVAVTPSPAGGTQRLAANDGTTNHYTVFAFDWGDQGAAGSTSYGVANASGTGTITKIAVEIFGTASAKDGDASAGGAPLQNFPRWDGPGADPGWDHEFYEDIPGTLAIDNRNSGQIFLSFEPSLLTAVSKQGLAASQLSTRPDLTASAQKATSSASQITAHPTLLTTSRKDSQSTAALSTHPAIIVVTRKTAQVAAILTAHPAFVIVSARLVGSSVAITMRPAITASTQKGAQGSPALTQHPAITSVGRKGAQAAVTTTTHPSLTCSTSKTGATTAVLSTRVVTSLTAAKGGQGSVSTTFHPSFAVTGGPPAQSQPKLTFRPNLSALGRKDTSGSAAVTAHHSFSVTSGKGARGTVTCTVHPNVAAVGRKVGQAAPSLTTRPALTTTTRRAAFVQTQIVVRPAFSVTPSQRASGTATIKFSPAFAVQYVVGGLAKPIRPLNTRGYIGAVRTGNLVGSQTGDIPAARAGMSIDADTGDTRRPQTGSIN